MLKKIENFHNYLSDTNYVWFPFLFLKLKPEEELTIVHMFKMTLCFGFYLGLMYHVKVYFETGQLGPEAILISILKGFMLFFVWFNVVTRPIWNRRVKRLSLEGKIS
jgi:hypothetical protein